MSKSADRMRLWLIRMAKTGRHFIMPDASGLLKIIRNIAWAGVLVAMIAFGISYWKANQPQQGNAPLKVSQLVGGSFVLTDSKGQTITEKDFLGRPFLVFFGFTHCPDVCPTTLFEASTWLKSLGSDADRLQVLFVSVDPGRDTPELLNTYLQAFDPRIKAATGTKSQIDAIVQSYKATYRIVPAGTGNYTVDHTALMFMMDSKGRFFGTIDYHEKTEIALEKLRRLLSSIK